MGLAVESPLLALGEPFSLRLFDQLTLHQTTHGETLHILRMDLEFWLMSKFGPWLALGGLLNVCSFV